MPILSVVGRKARRMRLIITALYVILAARLDDDGVPVPDDDQQLVHQLRGSQRLPPHPPLLAQRRELFRKYEEAKYNENIVYFNQFLGRDEATFADLKKPMKMNEPAVKDWQEFCNDLPPLYTDLASRNRCPRLRRKRCISTASTCGTCSKTAVRWTWPTGRRISAGAIPTSLCPPTAWRIDRPACCDTESIRTSSLQARPGAALPDPRQHGWDVVQQHLTRSTGKS